MKHDLSEIREKGFKALTKELGPAGMAIFIRQFEKGDGNYTNEREDAPKDITIEDIVTSIKKKGNK